MPEPSGFEARRAARLHDAAVPRPYFGDGARIAVRHGDVEARTAIAAVLDEPETGGLRVELGPDLEVLLPHALFVRFEEVHRARSVVATSPARDAVAAVR